MAELYQTDLPKSTYKFVCKGLLQIINRASLGPEAVRYKCALVRSIGEPFLQSTVARAIVDRLQMCMQYIPNIVVPKNVEPTESLR
jgi:hypothetical protein